MPRPVFKTGLAGITLAGGFDSLPPPPTGSLLQPSIFTVQSIEGMDRSAHRL